MRLVLKSALPLLIVFAFAPVVAPQKKDQYAEHIAPTDPRSPEEQKKLFRLPPGFEIQLVAAEPEIKKPININFDAKGRLWVTSSVEYPFPAKPGQPTRDTVKILEDFAPDGKARKVSTFADNLNIPIGVLPYKDGAIVYTIPHIVHLRDTKGTGKADKRDVLYTGYGHADTHGMTGEFVWGFDGWIYACHGFSNSSKVKSTGKDTIEMQSGNTYRFKPDGSKIEYFTHGQVNPFGLAFDPWGNLYSADCHTQPVYQLLKGAYYPSFGKPHDGLGFAPEMMNKYKGSTAIGGIAYYAADHYPKEYRGTLFFGDVITNQIVQVKFKREGTTPKVTSVPEFLVCSDKWFRPVDIKLGPDGALYFADFYTPIIGHYEVPLNHPKRDNQHGRIWRVVYKGKDTVKTLQPLRDFTASSVEALVKDLESANLTVQMTAANELVKRGGADVIQKVKKGEQDGSRQGIEFFLWVLERLGASDDAILEDAMGNRGAVARTHSSQILAERKQLSPEFRQQIIGILKDYEYPEDQRSAAQALGAHPVSSNIQPLLACLAKVPAADNHLTHVLRMSLRDQFKNEDHFAELPKLKLNDRDRKAIADVCLGLTNAGSARYLMEQVESLPNIGGKLPDYVRHIARYGPPDNQGKLADVTRQKFASNWPLQGEVYVALVAGVTSRSGRIDASTRTWGEEVAGKLLQSTNQKQAIQGAELAGLVGSPKLQEPLRAIVLNAKASEAIRKPALASLMTFDAKGTIATLGQILGNAASPSALREQAASILGATNQATAHAELLKGLATAPAKLETTFAMHLAKSPAGAEKLLEAVAAGKASPRLLQEQAVLVNLQQAKVKDLDTRLKTLTKGLPPADVALLKLLSQRREVFTKAKTDVAAGQLLFEKHCASCHQIGGKGAKVGPNLDGLGLRGVDRIIEDILDPNRNVDQAFRSTHLTLKKGAIVAGLLLREEGAVLVMSDAQGKEVRVAKDDVDERRVSGLSPMPANFADQITEPEFAHLLAYLLSQRPTTKE